MFYTKPCMIIQLICTRILKNSENDISYYYNIKAAAIAAAYVLSVLFYRYCFLCEVAVLIAKQVALQLNEVCNTDIAVSVEVKLC